ncbi:MAG: hypothetical protein H6R17_2556, partial [Proteobacteria bacterium]|nr:hypothetical protein [Pseudomonadota bacterium]
AAGTGGDVDHRFAVQHRLGQQFAAQRLPDTRRAVTAGGKQHLAVVAVTHRQHRAVVAHRRRRQRLRGDVPDPRLTVEAGRRQVLAVRAESEVANRRRMIDRGADRLAASQVEELHRSSVRDRHLRRRRVEPRRILAVRDAQCCAAGADEHARFAAVDKGLAGI